MNPAPAHLEAKLRFGWDFTVGQIAAMIVGILIGFAWANWLSPIRGIGAAVTGVYVGGLPVAAAFVASQTEFDLWAVVFSALRWRRAGGRFVPGCGEVAGLPGARRRRRSRGRGRRAGACWTPSCSGARRDARGQPELRRESAADRSSRAMIEAVKTKRAELREAGELLGVEAVDRTGLVITSEGAFVRIFRVAPVNPLLMSGEEREKAAAYVPAADLPAARRRADPDRGRGPSGEPRPSCSADCRREVEACAGPPPGRAATSRDPLSLLAVAAVRVARGVAAVARRQPGGGRGQPLRGRAVRSRASTSRAPRSPTRGAGSCRPRRSSGR